MQNGTVQIHQEWSQCTPKIKRCLLMSYLYHPNQIFQLNCKTSGLVCQNTGKNSMTINMTIRNMLVSPQHKGLSSSITSQSLLIHTVGLCVLEEFDTLNYIFEVWVLYHLSSPLPLHIHFCENIFFVLLNKDIDSQNIHPKNISALQYPGRYLIGWLARKM